MPTLADLLNLNPERAASAARSGRVALRELETSAGVLGFDLAELPAGGPRGVLAELRAFRDAVLDLEAAAEETRAGGLDLARLLGPDAEERSAAAAAFVRGIASGSAIVAAEKYELPPDALESVCENLDPPLEALNQAADQAAARARVEMRRDVDAEAGSLRAALNRETARRAGLERELEASYRAAHDLRSEVERLRSEVDHAATLRRVSAVELGASLAAVRELRASAEESEAALEEARANERRWRANHEAAETARAERPWEDLNNNAPGGRDGEAWELAAEELALAFEAYYGEEERSPEAAAEALRQAGLRLAPRLSALYEDVWASELYTSPVRAARYHATNWLSEAAAALGELAGQAAFGDLAGR